MSIEESDPAEVIAHALLRLRGRRNHGFGPRGEPGEHGGGYGDHGHHGHHGHHDTHAHPGIGEPPWVGGHRGGLGGPAWMRMLDALAAASDPLSVSTLGEAIGVDQPRASRLVQQGVDRGVVRREADPDDARRTRIALTDEGRGVTRGMRGQRRETLRRALTDFSDDDARELARLLAKLADNWQE